MAAEIVSANGVRGGDSGFRTVRRGECDNRRIPVSPDIKEV
jgi:hypothetical protein